MFGVFYFKSIIKMEISNINTDRGFPLIEFKDFYNQKCKIQISSIFLEERAIWFGKNFETPQILASDAYKFAIETDKDTGWVDFPLPKEVSVSTHMHLTQSQVKELLPILIKFAETGKLF